MWGSRERESTFEKVVENGQKKKREQADTANVKNMGTGIQSVILCPWSFLKKEVASIE